MARKVVSGDELRTGEWCEALRVCLVGEDCRDELAGGSFESGLGKCGIARVGLAIATSYYAQSEGEIV